MAIGHRVSIHDRKASPPLINVDIYRFNLDQKRYFCDSSNISKRVSVLSTTMSTATKVAAQSAFWVTAEQDQAKKVLVVQSDKPKSALEAISQGASLPPIPCYSDMDHQRRFMLEYMAGAFRVFSRKGYTEGMSGHISLRDPENPEYFWTNPYVSTIAKR